MASEKKECFYNHYITELERLMPKDKYSDLENVVENIEIPEPETAFIAESGLCPKCHCGRVRIVKKGVAVNGNPYTTYACTNERYGCDYLETKFVNLNGYQVSIKTGLYAFFLATSPSQWPQTAKNPDRSPHRTHRMAICWRPIGDSRAEPP